MSCLLIAAAILLLTRDADGYGPYQNKIPNGDSLPSPCNPNKFWRGVGHLNAQGGGIRNKFGLDFAAAERKWTAELCNKDSDGDGKTNGQELGDPDCTWKEGDTPAQLTGLSHPAVCEPIDSENCKSQAQEGGLYFTQEEWMDDACKSGVFECNATKAPEVQTQTFRIPPTKVPAEVTSYMCQTFRVDDASGDPRHLIATRAIINNTNVMHHMVLFACRNGDETPIFDKPYVCGMSPGYGCNLILSVWTLGLEGECMHENAGIKVGTGGYTVLAMQYHWNNPTEEDSYVDSSGMELYFTPTLRENNAGVAMFGQEYLQIPPNTDHTMVTSECSSNCLSTKIKNNQGEGIYITYAFNHMHYLGVAQSVELHRDGRFLRNITNDPVYNYDSPRTYSFDEPIHVLPGDRIVTKCHYKSTKRGFTTFFGEETSDEMCYVFFSYYPQENMPNSFCTTQDTRSWCDPSTYNRCEYAGINKFFQKFNESDFYRNITQRCRPFLPCLKECKEAILDARAADPCFADPVSWKLVVLQKMNTEDPDFTNFLANVASCQVDVYLAEQSEQNPGEPSSNNDNNNGITTTTTTDNDNNNGISTTTTTDNNNGITTTTTTDNVNNNGITTTTSKTNINNGMTTTTSKTNVNNINININNNGGCNASNGAADLGPSAMFPFQLSFVLLLMGFAGMASIGL